MRTKNFARVDAESRFWDKVNLLTESGCWEWLAATAGPRYKVDGYGQFWVTNKTKVIAHRYSYELHNGRIPDGMFVCHSCDNPRCVNPAHLFLGTARDNVQDMIAKGRKWAPSNEEHPSHIFSDAQIAEIRRRHVKGKRKGEGSTLFLANEFGTTAHYVRKVVSGQRRKESGRAA